jgi:carbon-monoxide dehydrogenase small subunit|tara:strand:- start:1349 stop:1819 length:471 start_codon:yes stop_codon:yes gene_type:complete
MAKISIKVNGKKITKEVSDNAILSDFLRDKLALTGTHIGCDTSQCGACVVHLNGNSVKSCTTLIADCDGAEITTIEGLTSNGKMHSMQEAFKKHHGLQCGFCTPGMVMSAVDLLQKNKNPSEKEIRDWLEGNICRCTGYQGIVAAVKDAASKNVRK